MRTILLAISALLLSNAATAYAPDLSDLSNVRQLTVNASTVKSAMAGSKSQPLQFAVGVALGATTNDGSWDEPETGIARWRLRVHSDGAASLNFALSKLQLPSDATLYLYTDGGHDVQGPYTAANNGAPVLPIVRGETAVFEARMPSSERDAFAVQIVQAFHGYRDITGKSFANGGSTGTGASGSCEINVACPAGDNWRNEIRSAVLLTIVVPPAIPILGSSSEYLCSGSLVNNAAQDDRALILTANHCQIRSNNVTSATAYFNVQASACTNGTAGSVTENIAGKTLIAGTSGTTVTDYTLFELASAPPASYNVHYAGWEVSNMAPRSGVDIHHPSGDDKKISTYATAASAADNVDFTQFKADTWAVTWSQGTTEEGSSGSGLLNQNRRIVGTLSGGNGACSGQQNNGQQDYFARLDRAWTAASSTNTTLKAALAGNSGCTTLDGKDPGAASAANCNGSSTGGGTTGGTTTAGSSSSSNTSNSGGGGGGGSLDLWLTPLALLALRRRRPHQH